MNKLVAILLIIILSPILLLTCLLIMLSDGFPIIYKQKRYGKDNKVFELLKFRTMKQNTPIMATENLNNSANYLIPFGSIIRKWSLDELPQFMNIIKGDINFIGPRPSLFNNEEIVNEMRKELGITKIKPGITGWAQVNGRDNNSFEEKVKLDYYYMTNKNLILDLKIILLTFFVIFTKRGVKH